MSFTANTTYMASFPKRPNITGAPDKVFKFYNFLFHLIRGIKANTISTIGIIKPESLCTQFLYAPQIHFNLAGNPIAFIGNLSNKTGKFSLIKINVMSFCLFPYIKDKVTMDANLNHGEDMPADWLIKIIGKILRNTLLVRWFPTSSSLTLGKFYPMATSMIIKSRQNLFNWAQDTN
jgi:hypothetical protein